MMFAVEAGVVMVVPVEVVVMVIVSALSVVLEEPVCEITGTL